MTVTTTSWTEQARAGHADTWKMIGNLDVDWDEFDSEAYFDHNYGMLRPDDRQIIGIVTSFFDDCRRRYPDTWLRHAIDVGAGANLYPALAMLPFTSEITLFERASSNCSWLDQQLRKPNDSWWQFWSEMALDRDAYGKINDPLDLLSRRAHVTKGNLFRLEPGRYDMGTMFFVAESITTREDEFQRAVGKFVGSLRRHAPFAAAFMKNSSGYRVGNVNFPACSVEEDDIVRALAGVARDVTITTVDSKDLRDGYGGMIVATGRKMV
ncbi:SCO2525 family SAM-dependent methyltransferase [Symbioplanes lichenis]|uniref:SCO2525 family SAM-dependent methyltransferase n=1 Tax=Symbioplanes lichenis TaxID=1629072 RepID=UPI00273A2A96|nr:SCO2525 family SAM-dependent methyltransferase [Actinoplanes lichenis]